MLRYNAMSVSLGAIAKREIALLRVDRATLDELPHDYPEGVNVAGLMQTVPLRDLRRHVEGCPLFDIACVARAVLHAHGEAEVGDLDGGCARGNGFNDGVRARFELHAYCRIHCLAQLIKLHITIYRALTATSNIAMYYTQR
jgi:hypothetical protein